MLLKLDFKQVLITIMRLEHMQESLLSCPDQAVYLVVNILQNGYPNIWKIFLS